MEREDKVNVFSQGRIIKLLGQDGKLQLSEENFEKIKNGICYMLSMEWLNKFVQAPSDYPKYDEVNENTDLLDGCLAYYKQIAMNFIHYLDLLETTSEFKLVLKGAFAPNGSLKPDVLNKELGKLCSRNKLDFLNYKDFCNKTDFIDAAVGNLIEKYALFGFFFLRGPKREKVGHMTAFVRVNGILYFFDPNYGIYKLTPNEKESEATLISELYDDLTKTYDKFESSQLSYT